MRDVCVFAASSAAVDGAFCDAAFELGRLLALNGLGLVFGGGRMGLMGACARGADAEGGRITGVIPERLNQPGIAFERCTELIVTPDMRSRKAKMEELSSAHIALPGGFGTLEELMEIITLNQLGYINSPVVVLNSFGFYDHLAELFGTFVERGFTDGRYLSIIKMAATPREAVDAILTYERPDLPDKIKEAINHG